MLDDSQLLRRFVEESAQDAFAELVQRRVNLVYSAALRQVGGDAHLAQDVAQGVFVALARSARSLTGRAALTGWLYTATRFTAAKIVRERRRRSAREQEADHMNQLMNQAKPEPQWNDLRPVLDEAMHELDERDRDAILLRYFEGRAFAEVGAACGLNENSARMRVERALEKLRTRLARRGITSTAGALAGVLSQQAVSAAPAAVAVMAAGAGLAGAGAASGTTLAFELMKLMTKKNLATAALVSLLGTGTYLAIADRVEAGIAEEKAADERVIAALRAGNRSLNESNLQLAAQPTKEAIPVTGSAAVAAPEPLARLREIVQLIKSDTLGMVRWGFLSDPGSFVSPAVTDLFALTSAEAESLRRAAVTADAEIARLAIASARVQRNGNELVIDLAAPAGVRESHERMMEQFRQVLGSERFALAQEIGWTGAIESLLNNHGLNASTIVVTRFPNPPRPGSDYGFSQGRNGPDGSEGGGGIRTNREGLRQTMGPLDVLVPPDL